MKVCGSDGKLDGTTYHELASPGFSYDDAFRIVYWAARHRLKDWHGSRKDHEQDWAIAVGYLRRLGFQVLRLPDFLRIQRLPCE